VHAPGLIGHVAAVVVYGVLFMDWGDDKHAFEPVSGSWRCQGYNSSTSQQGSPVVQEDDGVNVDEQKSTQTATAETESIIIVAES